MFSSVNVELEAGRIYYVVLRNFHSSQGISARIIARRGAASPEDSIVYTYDSRGRLKTATYPSGLVITFEYDVMGNIIGVTRSE